MLTQLVNYVTTLYNRFPQIKTDLDREITDIDISDGVNGRLLLSFDLSAEGIPGTVHYLDVERNLNGSSLDQWETVFKPHYITSQVPDGLTDTAENAAVRVSSLLEKYSCFQLTPWNIQAEYDNQKQEGYYRMTFQPEYQGIPIYGHQTMTRAFESSKGIFICDGLMMLKECDRREVQSSGTREQAIEAFVNSISALSSYDAVQCNSIRLGYLAAVQDDNVVMSPAWVFECSEKQSATNQDFVNYFQAAFLIQEGKFWTSNDVEEMLIDPL